MPKKKQDMTEAEREKMLAKLQKMRDTMAEKRKAKAEANGGEQPKAEVFKKPEPAAPKPIPVKEPTLNEKLEKISTQLETITQYKMDKISERQKEKQKADADKEKSQAPPVVVQAAQVVEPAFQFPRSYGNRFFGNQKF